MRSHRYLIAWPASLVAVLIVLSGPVLAADTPSDDDTGHELLSIPSPDYTGMEPRVETALRASRDRLMALGRRADLADRERAEAFGELGGTYQIHNLYGVAEPCYRNAEMLAPEDFRWPYYLGYVYSQTHRPEQAIRSYQRALARQPGNPYAQLRLAYIHIGLNQADQAAPLLRRPAEIPELRAAALYGLGKVALLQRDYQRAVQLFEETLAVYPEADKVHYPLAMAYRGLGDVVQARDHLGQVGEGEPRIPDPMMDELTVLLSGARPHLYRAMDAVRGRHFDEAAEAFGAALELDPDNVNARVSWARSLYIIGDKEAAYAQLREALRRNPDHDLAHFFLGVLLEQDGDVEAALRHYHRALAINPDNGGAHHFLGSLAMRSGDYERAAHHYGQAVRSVPEDLPARLLEAVSLVRAGAPPGEARQRLSTALETNPENPILTYALARLLAASPDGAVRDGSRALELAKTLYAQAAIPEHTELMAMAYAELGDFQKAIALQNEAWETAMMMGRYDLQQRLSENLELYQADRACRDPWPASDPVFQPQPVDALGPLRDYPAAEPI